MHEHQGGDCDAMPGKSFLGDTTSCFLRDKPRQVRRQWDPGVAGPGDRDCQAVEVIGRDVRWMGRL